jgi:hypothetical protein
LTHYKHFRPHQGIDGLVPADRFFKAEDLARRTIEKAVGQNALAEAIAQKPRRPVFLFGQIGDRQVSLHGEHGRLVIHTAEGQEEAIHLESEEASADSASADTPSLPATTHSKDAKNEEKNHASQRTSESDVSTPRDDDAADGASR